MARRRKSEPANPPIGHVLVVEDDGILAMAIEMALRDAGVLEITVCAGTAEAMETLDHAPPEVVVLDVHLADSDDGWALAELIDLLGPRRPRIFFSTASPQDIPAEIAGMGDIFAKPYDPAELAAAICAEPGKPGLLGRLRAAIP